MHLNRYALVDIKYSQYNSKFYNLNFNKKQFYQVEYHNSFLKFIAIKHPVIYQRRLPGGSTGRNPPAHAEDKSSIPGREGPLEKEMATLTSILAWEIPWTEEPGRLPSTGSQKSWTQFSD